MLDAFLSSPPSFSTAATFFARVTAIFKPFQNILCGDGLCPARYHVGTDALVCPAGRSPALTLSRRLGRSLNRPRVQRNPRTHARTEIASLDVLALGDR